MYSERNICHRSEKRSTRVWFFFSPQRSLMTSCIRNNFLARSALMQSVVLFFLHFFFHWITSKIKAESVLKTMLSLFIFFSLKCASILTPDKFITLRLYCCLRDLQISTICTIERLHTCAFKGAQRTKERFSWS